MVVVADHTKIGKQALAFLCDLSEVDVLILDNQLMPAQRELIDRPELREALPADQWQALRNRTEDDSVRSEVDNFVNGYRSNAMSGLAVVGDEDALRQLRELAGRGSTPEAVAARGALAYRESLTTR